MTWWKLAVQSETQVPWQQLRRAGRVPSSGGGVQMGLEPVEAIDPESYRDQGMARLLRGICSQLVRRQHLGVKVAQLIRDVHLDPQELKKHHLITKQCHGRLSCRPPCSAMCFPLGPSFRTGRPLARDSDLHLMAATGLDSLARPHTPTLGMVLASVPTAATTTAPPHLGTSSARLCTSPASTSLPPFLAPQPQLAYFCQAGLGLELVKGSTEQQREDAV